MREPMEQSTKSNSVNVKFFDDDEIRVSEIMLDLPNLISDSEWRCQFPFTCWGKKRKRSVLDSTTSTTSPSLCRQPVKERKILKAMKKKVEAAAVVVAAATSPSTPLSFSPSESDENKSSKQSLKSNSKKRTKEEWLEIIDGLNHNRELLRGELDSVRSKHFKLNAINLELKAKKQELSFSQKTEKPPQLGINGGWNLGLQLDHHYQMTMFAPHQKQQQQFLMDQAAQISGRFQDLYGQRIPMGSSPYNGLSLINQMGPRGIPDLNVCAEETFVLGPTSSQPLDLMSRVLMDNNSRFRAAEARRRRMMKIKEVKNQGRSHHGVGHGPLIC